MKRDGKRYTREGQGGPVVPGSRDQDDRTRNVIQRTEKVLDEIEYSIPIINNRLKSLEEGVKRRDFIFLSLAMICIFYILYNSKKTPGENIDSCLEVGKELMANGYRYVSSIINPSSAETQNRNL